MSWCPQIDDTGIKGAIISSTLVGGTAVGILIAWQIQDLPGSQYSGPSNIGQNPLVFEYSAQYVVDDRDSAFSPGQYVTFDLIAAEYGAVATNVQIP
jgi:hypothetical protein